MKPEYIEIREMARKLVRSYPDPPFHATFSAELDRSATHFATELVVTEVTRGVEPLLAEDFGHGMAHSRKVAIDAGVLVLVEGRRLKLAEDSLVRRLTQAHLCGILHDVCRKEPDHARRGAERAARILADARVPAHLADPVCEAIRRHEAFQDLDGEVVGSTELLSDCLYDADKFRWGPDNFAHTVWQMLTLADIPLTEFIRHYPGGVRKIATIRNTFRSETGKAYGPAFIDAGIAIGKALYLEIARAYAPMLGQLPPLDAMEEAEELPTFTK